MMLNDSWIQNNEVDATCRKLGSKICRVHFKGLNDPKFGQESMHKLRNFYILY